MDKKEQNLRFFDSWAKTYDRSFLLGYWLRRMQADVVSFVEKSKGLKLLDVGCGTGELLLMLSEKLENPGLYGIDISKNMLMIAEKKLGGKALLKISDVESLPFKDKSFSSVISLTAFHHFDADKTIKEIKRVVNDNSPIAISLLKKTKNFKLLKKKLLKEFNVKKYDCVNDIAFIGKT